MWAENMPLWALAILFFCGIILVIKGGDFFVDAAVWIASASGIPDFIIGATVVSFATAFPEILVSCIGAAKDSDGIAVGNAVGTVASNTGLIMAVLMICAPRPVKKQQYFVKAVLLITAVSVLYLSLIKGEFSPIGSVVLLLLSALSVFENIKDAKRKRTIAEKKVEKKEIPINSAKFLFGGIGIVSGADLLVKSATASAVIMGIPEAVVSAAVLAVGTSLPELVTTVTAIVKKQSALSVGNIIGANIIDITLILPLCSFFSHNGLSVCKQNVFLDLPVCLTLTVFSLLPMLIKGKFSRLQGILLLSFYLIYILLISFFNPFY